MSAIRPRSLSSAEPETIEHHRSVIDACAGVLYARARRRHPRRAAPGVRPPTSGVVGETASASRGVRPRSISPRSRLTPPSWPFGCDPHTALHGSRLRNGHRSRSACRRPAAKWRRCARAGCPVRLVIAVLVPISVLGIGAGALLRQRYDDGAGGGIDRRRTSRRSTGWPTSASCSIRSASRSRAGCGPSSSASTSPTSRPSSVSPTSRPLRRGTPPTSSWPRSEPRRRPGSRSALVALRRQVDAGTIAPTTADRDFSHLDGLLSAAFSARLATLQTRIAGLSDSADLQASLRSLSAANDALGAGVAELGDVSNIELPGNHPGVAAERARR